MCGVTLGVPLVIWLMRQRPLLLTFGLALFGGFGGVLEV